MVAETKTWAGTTVRDGNSTGAIRIAIVGADVVGLATALILETTLRGRSRIEVFDAGLRRSLVGFQHRRRADASPGMSVTVDPGLMSVLPAPVATAIVSARPPASHDGRMAVGDLETALLRAVERKDVRVHDEDLSLTDDRVRRFDLTVLCREDGGIGTDHPVGRTDTNSGKSVEETILSMSCRLGIPLDEAASTNGWQRRARAFPGTGGDVLSIRLSTSEASLLRWIAMRGREAGDPLPSTFQRDRSEASTFRSMSGDHALRLDHPDLGAIGRRIASVLALYGVDMDTVDLVSLDRVAPTRRSRFTMPFDAVLPRSGTTTLLGSAAFSGHPWSQGDLSSGLRQALSLAECLARDWKGPSGSIRDLAQHEGEMHRLQFLGELRSREEATDLATGKPLTRILDDAVFAMEDTSATIGRVKAVVRDRISGPAADAITGRLDGLDDQSLRMLASVIAPCEPTPMIGTVGISVLRTPDVPSYGKRLRPALTPSGILSRLKGEVHRLDGGL